MIEKVSSITKKAPIAAQKFGNNHNSAIATVPQIIEDTFQIIWNVLTAIVSLFIHWAISTHKVNKTIAVASFHGLI